MKKIALFTNLILYISISCIAQPVFNITFEKDKSKTPLDGRLILMFSKNNEKEPRFQIEDGLNTQQAFGIDVDNWLVGQIKTINNINGFGYPIRKLKNLPKGEYYLQALLHKYETFKRKDGHIVKLPMDRGEGQQWHLAPGNIYSTPVKITFDPLSKKVFNITLENEIPPVKEPEDTKYIKHIKIQSKLLTEFWRRPMYLGAHILLPKGFDEHPSVKYPLAIYHGHFPSDFSGFRTTPPEPDLKPDYSARFKINGYNKIVQQEAYDFFKIWAGPNFPRVIAIEIQHPCPYYDEII